ncbi:MAG TPA: sugar phosphate isomerase/epimerase [Verrucomicrobiae bacterium]|nr:sugar phosphate isomerase/epimerase [Verrucomicrobiae bacterium]
MEPPQNRLNRRDFLVSAASATVALGLANQSTLAAGVVGDRKIKLGLDNFAVRALKWKADALIDYAVQLKTDSLFITDLFAFENFDESYLTGLRRKAADHGLDIQVGSWSICPTSKSFKKDWGTAEEHLALGIRVAKALGSPVFRVVLGSQEDRKTQGGIEARIEDTVKVCKALRSRAMDAGVKIAIENHAGDMQARELVQLIEAAGKEYVGANMDSGNAVWTLEDPMLSLEILGPYALTTSLRDSAIWESEKGATVQWTAMGDGTLDLKAYFKRFAELCPGIPVHIETISGFNRDFPYLQTGFWEIFPNMPVRDFARFLALAKKGKARDPWKAPPGAPREKAEQDHQKEEIEKSIRYCKEVLGLGLKA